MENNSIDSLKGQLLMAMPLLVDHNFYQTVTCICEYTPAGTVGIVINRVHPTLMVKDIFNELNMEFIPDVESTPIHIGGPVHVGEIFILVAMGRGPKLYLIALGCAGWGPGQIESEIKANAWLTSPIDEDIIFDMPIEERWEASLKKIGVDPALIMNISGHA
jgi:putative transcriptional regulator